MHAYATLGMLALAGSAMAAPKPHFGGHGGNPHIVWETAVVTVIVGPDGQPIDAAAPTPAPEPSQGYVPAPAEPTTVVVESPPQSYQVPEQPSPTPSPEPYTPAPSPSPTPEPSNPPSSGGGYIDIANQWRAKLGLPAYEQDETLQNNALKTCNDGNGEMVHELNPGTFGQTLAPGQPDEFEHVFVGAWLCERPDLPGLNGICDTMSQGWAYGGQTGHADIITGDYKKIGCANAKGIWGCDYA
ncbi:uncharacterized protein CC84DRAFT_1167986 [Paraphaeosphaeria sporulosa]|uniref:SCP domain-containing protein n=1 Tax=Paraphaeosphaeria sporulosa TaxID=1460663 RepID=A0A177C389_9PLEO|nr:uncharacterized protein CC84DRAFT_1167986 [Paraphaeosphaeria sporulosa]OAG01856.1 hypothetical protein CC84DRAFT_1167986 [Paraphaeosphaeria sporulosa]